MAVPSPVASFVTWSKANTAIAGALGTDISSKRPNDTVPWMEVRRLPGADLLAEAPLTTARLQLTLFGGRKSPGNPDWKTIDPIVAIIESEVKAFRGWDDGTVHISDLTLLEGAQQLEDPDTGDAIYWLDVLVTVRRYDGGA